MCYNIDSEKLKEKLDLEKIKIIMSSLGASYNSENGKEIKYTSICHNSDKYKLYLYKDNLYFYCYHSECSCSYNIYTLVMRVKSLNFPSALQYICDVCNIPYDETKRLKSKNIDDWKSLKKYLKNTSENREIKSINKSILKFFGDKRHTMWLNEGISEKTLEKFGIGYYDYKQTITIPIHDINGNLVGIRGRTVIPDHKPKYSPIITLDGTSYAFPINSTLYGLNYTQEAIRSKKQVLIAEGEKTILKLQEYLGYENNGVALMGANLNKHRRDLLLNLGINEVIFLADRDFEKYDTEEYLKWEKSIFDKLEVFKGYCRVYVAYDKYCELSYKDNITDKDEKFFKRMLEEKEIVYE